MGRMAGEDSEGRAQAMKWIPNAFRSDRVQLTWWDLLKLAIGLEIKDSACRVRRGAMKP